MRKQTRKPNAKQPVAKPAKTSATSPATPAPGESGSGHADALRDVVALLGRLVESNLPGRHPVAYLFRQASYADADDYTPSIERLAAAMNALRAMPRDARDRVCNGWTADPILNPVPREEIEQTDREVFREVSRVMTIRPTRTKVIASQEWECIDGVEPVSLKVRFGTSKRELLDALERISDTVRYTFEQLIGTEFAAVDPLSDGVDAVDHLRGEADRIAEFGPAGGDDVAARPAASLRLASDERPRQGTACMKIGTAAHGPTEKSRDREGRPVRVGDFIADLMDDAGGGEVVFIAGEVLLYQRRQGGATTYHMNTCQDSRVLVDAVAKGAA